MDLAFYLFRFHHWTPEQYYAMSHGGRDMTWGFVLREIELREEAESGDV